MWCGERIQSLNCAHFHHTRRCFQMELCSDNHASLFLVKKSTHREATSFKYNLFFHLIDTGMSLYHYHSLCFIFLMLPILLFGKKNAFLNMVSRSGFICVGPQPEKGPMFGLMFCCHCLEMPYHFVSDLVAL